MVGELALLWTTFWGAGGRRSLVVRGATYEPPLLRLLSGEQRCLVFSGLCWKTFICRSPSSPLTQTFLVFNKNLNASKPSEHPPSGEKMSKRLRWFYRYIYLIPLDFTYYMTFISITTDATSNLRLLPLMYTWYLVGISYYGPL